MKTTDIRKLLAAVALCMPALCAGAAAEVLGDSVATVNGEPVLRSEYDKTFRAIEEQYAKAMPNLLADAAAKKDLQKKVLDQMIDDTLLTQAAEKAQIKVRSRELDAGISEVKARFQTDETGAPVPEAEAEAAFNKELKAEGISYEQFKERIKKQLMVRKYMEESIRPKAAAPTEEETKACFDSIQELIKGSTQSLKGMPAEDAQSLSAVAQRIKDLAAERVRVQHILFKAGKDTPIVDKLKKKSEADKICAELKAGGDFRAAAAKYSDDKESAGRGGDIGFIIRGWMPREFEDAAFSANVGDIIGPVETEFGYHIIKVTEKKARQDIGFDDVKAQLAQYLAGRKVQKEMIAVIKDLRAKAAITIK
ncbi:MAG: peptidylprolyl isomerase [Elusimicrobiaceae bacterium]|nr:peptidylprolyl isomerase [Elusimicrobiaceae bacterium]